MLTHCINHYIMQVAQVNTATVNVNVQCCHVGYVHDCATGRCVFKYSQNNNDILREDMNNHIYIYIRVRLQYYYMHVCASASCSNSLGIPENLNEHK